MGDEMKHNLNSKSNRFAQRTLADFSGGLLQILERKSFESIKVGELCDACNYPRATFYNYFDDIFDLLDYCWILLTEKFDLDDYEEISHQERTQILFARLYDCLEAESMHLQAIIRHNPSDGMMMNSFRLYLKKRIIEMIMKCPYNEMYSIPNEMVAEHYGNTIEMILEWCFIKKCRLSKAEAQQCIFYFLDTIEKGKKE